MATVPFGYRSYKLDSLPVSAQRLVNLYIEAVPSGKTPLFLRGTPGLNLFCDTGSTFGVRAMETFKGVPYAAVGDTLYSIDRTGASTDRGTIPDSGPVFMEEGTNALGILAGLQLYTNDGLTLSIVSDPDLPQASTLAALDGYAIVTQYNSKKWNISALDDFTSWDGLDFASAEAAPDNLVRAIRSHRQVWLFCEETTEVWYDSGAASFPFERIESAFMEKGLAVATAVCRADNTLYWLGHDLQIYRATGFVPQRVSTNAIEIAIRKMAAISDCTFWSYVQDGHTHVVCNFPSGGATFVFDAATNEWHERQSYGLSYWRAGSYVYAYGKHLVGDLTTGKIYEINPDAYDENGNPLVATATAPPLSKGGVTITAGTVELECETGVGLTSGQGSDPTLVLSWSDDGGRNFKGNRELSLGKKGEYGRRVRAGRLGAFRTRIFRLTISDPVRRIVIGADLNI